MFQLIRLLLPHRERSNQSSILILINQSLPRFTTTNQLIRSEIIQQLIISRRLQSLPHAMQSLRRVQFPHLPRYLPYCPLMSHSLYQRLPLSLHSAIPFYFILLEFVQSNLLTLQSLSKGVEDDGNIRFYVVDVPYLWYIYLKYPFYVQLPPFLVVSLLPLSVLVDDVR